MGRGADHGLVDGRADPVCEVAGVFSIEPQAGGADREVAAAAGPLRTADRPVQQFDGDRVTRNAFKAGRKLGDGAGAMQRLAAHDGLP